MLDGVMLDRIQAYLAADDRRTVKMWMDKGKFTVCFSQDEGHGPSVTAQDSKSVREGIATCLMQISGWRRQARVVFRPPAPI